MLLALGHNFALSVLAVGMGYLVYVYASKERGILKNTGYAIGIGMVVCGIFYIAVTFYSLIIPRLFR